MKCPKCETDNPDTLKFCGECGTQLPPSEEISAPTETLEAAKEELTRGTTFAERYEIIEELGKGGMGKVYRVFDKKIEGEVALKLVKPEIAAEKRTIERFRNELKTAREIAHRNVCRMYDLNEEKGTYYITMEYVPGEDLKSSIRRFGQIPVGKTISIAKQVCEGLSEAHRLGVVHRDLKPNNIMIDKEGNARIMDFGIARSIKGKGITGAGVMIGTPEYMSPEQVEGKDVDQRSDIYSLGIILYEMSTGRVPFEGDTPFTVGIKQKSEIPKDPKEINAQIPDDLSLLILRCLEKDKEKRYQSAGEVSSELERIERGIPSTERVSTKRKPITSKEITVTFGLRKLLIPALVVIAIAIIGIIIWQVLPQKEGDSLFPGQASVAVLPFNDLSPQKDQGYLCDGLAESLINALTKVKELRVPATTSSFSFRGKEEDIQTIGEKLKVNAVLRGSVQKAGNRVRITAQLINIADESLIWSEQYNRELKDVFAIQDEISLAIVDMLKVGLLGEEKTVLLRRHTEDIEAYNLYLKGNWFFSRRTKENLNKALEYFEKAIGRDPNYALAYTGLAYTYGMIGDYGYMAPKAAFSMAKEAALKALEIDDSLAEAHQALAFVKFDHEWDWEGAEQEIKRALEINPNYAAAHHHYAQLLMCMARFEEALEEINRARELDPVSLIINRNTGQHFYRAREYDKAIDALQKTIEIDPNFIGSRRYLGLVYLQKSMYEQALEEFQKEKDIIRGFNPHIESLLGVTYALMRDKEKALQILEELEARAKEMYVASSDIAVIHFALGDNDQGFERLEKAYEERDTNLKKLKTYPLFDNVSSDSRFKELLKKMGLEK
ncbi:MAG: protein kinase [Candidatus Aminicenantes bacterium]|nr:protein kinase [Candidatus Aminicenantes bacterium]